MNEPKIRFQGFEGEWEEKKLGDMCSVNRGVRLTRKDLDSNGMYPVYQNTNYPLGYYNSYNVCKNNPYVIIGGSAGLIGYSCSNFWAADDCAYFGKNDNLNKFFLYNILVSKSSEIKKNVRGSSIPRLDRGVLSGLRIQFPPLSEQQAIASYFTHLDTLITSSASRLASLKQMKSASLQAMFPQEGETVPKIRFKGFEGEWEKVKLGEIGCFGKGRGYSKSDIIEVGTPLFLYGRLYTKYSFFTDKVDTYAQLKDGSIISDGDEVVLPASGETPEDIACASAILSKGIILGGDLNIIKVDLQRYVTPFVALAISNGSTHYELSKFAQGKSVVHLQNSEIKNGSVMIPSLPEQQAIASYFTSLDKQIALQSQRLEKLKRIKSACLDKMFV